MVGNRTALTRTGGSGAPDLQTASYSFDFGTHRLTGATAGGVTRTLSYLSSGQLSSDTASGVPAKTFVYDGEGRMVEAREGGALEAAYAYDAHGQRVLKAPVSGTAVHYVYGPEGRLLAEHDAATGAPLREYVWAGLMPVVFIDRSGGSSATYYVHTDQVFRPQKLTDASGVVVWDRIETPFGVEVSITGSLTQPVRFPGQVEDLETALNQNWNRDYDPLLGRYIQSDPIGLMGGINTYAYVSGNPLTAVDPYGLDAIAVPGGFGPGVDNIVKGGSRLGGWGGAFAGAYIGGGYAGSALSNEIFGHLNESADLIGFPADAYCPKDGKDPCKGFQKQLKDHQQKLAQYLRDPISMDNKGFLAEALGLYDFQRAFGIQHTRIKELNRQIRNFKKQLQKCEEQNGLR